MKHTGKIIGLTVTVFVSFLWIVVHRYEPENIWPIRSLFIIIYAVLGWLAGKQYDRMRWFALKDQLTGTYNRNFIFEVLPKLLSQAERKESKLTVALVDVDDLKVINDTKGHKSGDAMLQQFADFLKDNIRSNDIVARWGGDEFLIIAPFTDGTTVEPLIHRLRGSAKSADIPFDFSVGTATFPDDAKDLNELVKIADLNMYREKRTKKERSAY